MCVFFGSMYLKLMLKDDFERLIWCLDHWLSSILNCIHVCVFLFSKNCFKSFLDTWLAFSYRKLDTSSTPGGSIKKVPIPSIAYRHLVDRSSLISCVWCFCTSILARHLYLSTAKSSTLGLAPLDTFFCRALLRFYLYFLAWSKPYFSRSLLITLSLHLPNLYLSLQTSTRWFFKLFQVFIHLVSF